MKKEVVEIDSLLLYLLFTTFVDYDYSIQEVVLQDETV